MTYQTFAFYESRKKEKKKKSIFMNLYSYFGYNNMANNKIVEKVENVIFSIRYYRI